MEEDGFVDFDWFRIDWNPLTGFGSGEDMNNNDVPEKFYLGQNYPNPFNPYTTIQYGLANESFVKLAVYDLLGRELEILESQSKSAGYYSTVFNSAGITSGIYFYTLQTNRHVLSRKMIILK
jgi:hypothetical protein